MNHNFSVRPFLKIFTLHFCGIITVQWDTRTAGDIVLQLVWSWPQRYNY